VSGPDRLTGPLVAALPTSLIESVICDSRHVVELDSPALAAAVDERLEAEHSQREVQLAQATLDGASGAAGVALGLSEVLAALNNARVAHLVAVYVSIAATPSFSRGDRECTGHERATRADRLLCVLERGGQVLEAAVHPIGHAPPPVRVANRRADLHRLGRAPLHRDIGDAQFADRRLHASQYAGSARTASGRSAEFRIAVAASTSSQA
jgi:hypothetical protein